MTDGGAANSVHAVSHKIRNIYYTLFFFSLNVRKGKEKGKANVKTLVCLVLNVMDGGGANSVPCLTHIITHDV